MPDTEKVKEFNQIIESFLIQVSPIVGTSYHFYYKKLIKVNAIEPIKLFQVEVVIPYKDKIFAKDETYFVNFDENGREKLSREDEYLRDFLKMKEIYHQIDDQSKEVCWQYLQALVVLSEEYHA
tara:strand:+ start:485 stop:856 length:372 start_codon:yes stop_codon:yes gene_type:complete